MKYQPLAKQSVSNKFTYCEIYLAVECGKVNFVQS